MKIISAKVIATGEEIMAMETEKDVFFCSATEKNYRIDELSDINDNPFSSNTPFVSPKSIPKREPFDTAAMLEKILDRQLNTFWRDQRVEIVKILLGHGASVEEVVSMADDIIRRLKEIED